MLIEWRQLSQSTVLNAEQSDDLSHQVEGTARGAKAKDPREARIRSNPGFKQAAARKPSIIYALKHPGEPSKHPLTSNHGDVPYEIGRVPPVTQYTDVADQYVQVQAQGANKA